MKRLFVGMITLLCLIVPASTVAAYNPLTSACSTGGSGSTACSGSNDPIVGSGGVLNKVTLIIATIAGIAAVIVIIIGGFQYITSGGDPQKAASARSAIIGAAIGLVIIAGAAGIITFVVSKI